MSNSITSATQTESAVRPTGSLQSAAVSNSEPSKPQSVTKAADTVQLSQAAQAALAALKEIAETSAQTTKEAAGGDSQARRLLAKEAEANPPNNR